MLNAMVRAWQEVLAKLPTILQIPSSNLIDFGAIVRNVGQVRTLLRLLHNMRQQPAAAWSELIVDKQVLQQLGVLWCSKVNPDRACEPGFSVATLAILEAFDTFFDTWSSDSHTLTCLSSSQGSDTSGVVEQLGAALQQQLVQSGLLDGLTQLIETTAQQLERCDTAAMATAHVSTTSNAAAAAAVPSGSSSSSNSGRHQRPAAGTANIEQDVKLTVIKQLAAKLLAYFVRVTALFVDDLSLQHVSGYAAASMHLTLAAVQHISLSLQQLLLRDDGQPPCPSLLGLAVGAVDAMVGISTCWGGHVRRHPPPAEFAAVLLTKEHCMAWSALTAVVAVYAEVLRQQQCLPEVQGLGSAHSSSNHSHDPVLSSTHSSRSGSSSRSRWSRWSSSSKAVRQGGGWSTQRPQRQQQRQQQQQHQQRQQQQQQHQQHQQEQEHQQQQAGLIEAILGTTESQNVALQAWQEAQGQWSSLPPTHTRLLEQLGCSAPAAVWLAATSWHLRDIGCAPLDLEECVGLLPQVMMAKATATVSNEVTDLPGQEDSLLRAAPDCQKQPASHEQSLENAPTPSPQQAQPAVEQCQLDSMLAAVLLYGVAHMPSNPDANPLDDHMMMINPYHLHETDYVVEATQALVERVAAFPSLQGHEVSLLPGTEANEMLLLCATALQHHRYPLAPISSHESPDQGLPKVARDWVNFEASLVNMLCALVNRPSNALSSQAGFGPPVHAATASTMLCAAEAVEPGSQSLPAAVGPVPPASAASQGTGPRPASTAAAAEVMCRALEVFVRRLANTISMSSELLLLQPEHEAAVLKITKLCSVDAAVSQPGQGTAGSLPALAATTGPGSELQVQLFSLWSSLLKLYAALGRLHTACKGGSTCPLVNLPKSCAETASFLLDPTPQYSVPDQATARDAALSHNIGAVMAASSSAVPAGGPAASATALGGQTSAGSSANSSVPGTTSTFVHPGLMWTMLLGRCCLHWADVIVGVEGCTSSHNANNTAELESGGAVNSKVPSITSIPVGLVAQQVQAFLGPNGSMAQQLSVSGYAIAPVTNSAAAALAAWDAAFVQSPDSASGSSDAKALPGLASAVKALGKALTSLAAPYCCNNPRCPNIGGPSDVALVSGKSCVCGKCKVARYCGKVCQQQHWRLHKPVCKALAAAQQAAGLASISTAG